jgi:hypothetical protein
MEIINELDVDALHPQCKEGEVGTVRPQELQRMSERDIEKLVPKIVKLKDNDFVIPYCRNTKKANSTA